MTAKEMKRGACVYNYHFDQGFVRPTIKIKIIRVVINVEVMHMARDKYLKNQTTDTHNLVGKIFEETIIDFDPAAFFIQFSTRTRFYKNTQ